MEIYFLLNHSIHEGLDYEKKINTIDVAQRQLLRYLYDLKKRTFRNRENMHNLKPYTRFY